MNNKNVIPERIDRPHRKVCMLMITHACNLNCTYCYEKHKSGRMMTVEKAKEIILHEMENIRADNHFREIQIDFMGGEPFVNFPLIKEIVEWLEGMDKPPVPWICFACTNATLLTEDVKAWLRSHRDSIWLAVSYDGLPEMQKENRGNNAVDIDFFKELWPKQNLHMTVSKESLPTLADGIISILKRGFAVEFAMAQGIEWDKADALLYYEQLTKLGEWFLQNPEYKPDDRLTMLRRPLANPREHTYIKQCGTGEGMITYDTDGTTYACHMFTPIVHGRERSLELNKLDWSDPQIMSFEPCNGCVLKMSCSTCPGFNFHYRGDIAARDLNRCLITLAEAHAACNFVINLCGQNADNISETDMAHLKDALELYDVLQFLPLESSESGPFVLPA